MDCILTYHINALTCGVAKFNAMLAGQLGIPMLSVFDPAALSYQAPLISIRFDELTVEDTDRFRRLLPTLLEDRAIRLFLHTYLDSEIEDTLVRRAEILYCGNAEIAARLHPARPDLVEAWCPAMLIDARPFAPVDITVFSFGMAHKVRAEHYRKVYQLLEDTGRSYCLYLSTALHQDTSLDGSFTQAYDELREIFGQSIHFLGYLSDAAVAHYLRQAIFFTAFFDRGVRANNTTVNAAMRAGRVVVTNLDAYSPKGFVHMETVIDIAQAAALPTNPDVLRAIGARAADVAEHELGWTTLLERIAARESRSTQGGRFDVAKPHHRR